MTLGSLAACYVDERRRRGDITSSTAEDLRSRLATLERSFGDRPIEQLDELAVVEWLGTIGWMKRTARRAYFSTVKVFCKWLVRRGHLAFDPTLELDPIREPRSIPRALPRAKVGALLEHRPDTRSQAVLWLMLGVALRCAEVAGLTLDDYDPAASTLFVRGKGSHERLVTAPTELRWALDTHLDAVGWLPGPIVRPIASARNSRRCEPMTGASVSKLVVGWMYGAGIKQRPKDGITPHCLRHTCASDVYEHCGDILVVQQLLGHASVATTMRYLRIAGLDKMRAAVEGRNYATTIAIAA